MTRPQPAGKDPVVSMLIITAGCTAVYYFTRSDLALIATVCLGFTGLTSKYLSNLVHILWWKLTALLSLVIPKIISTVIYFFVLVPVSVLSRLLGRSDTLRLK